MWKKLLPSTSSRFPLCWAGVAALELCLGHEGLHTLPVQTTSIQQASAVTKPWKLLITTYN